MTEERQIIINQLKEDTPALYQTLVDNNNIEKCATGELKELYFVEMSKTPITDFEGVEAPVLNPTIVKNVMEATVEARRGQKPSTKILLFRIAVAAGIIAVFSGTLLWSEENPTQTTVTFQDLTSIDSTAYGIKLRGSSEAEAMITHSDLMALVEQAFDSHSAHFVKGAYTVDVTPVNNDVHAISLVLTQVSSGKKATRPLQLASKAQVSNQLEKVVTEMIENL